MESRQKNSGLKAIVIILCLLLFGSLAYIFKMASDANAVQEELTIEKDEKKQIIGELEELKMIYDKAIEDNTALSDDLIAEREKVLNLIDDLRRSKMNAAEMAKFKDEYYKLKNQMKVLVAENNQLKDKNLQLETKIDSTSVVLNTEIDNNKKLTSQNDELAKKVDLGSKLVVSNLQVKAVRLRSSGKKVDTDRASRADEIEICFKLGANPLTPKGSKKYYVQVIDVNGHIVGGEKTEKFDNTELNYSKTVDFNFDGKALDLCEYLSINDKEFSKGVYFINIFDKAEMVAKTSITLK